MKTPGAKIRFWADGRALEEVADVALFFQPWYVHTDRAIAFESQGNNCRAALEYARTLQGFPGTIWISTSATEPPGGWPA